MSRLRGILGVVRSHVRHVAALGAVLGPVTVASGQTAGQLGFPDMVLDLSDDGVNYATELSALDSAYMNIRCHALAQAAGGWYGAIADAWFQPGVHPAMERELTPLWELADPFEPHAQTLYASNLLVPCRLVEGLAFMHGALNDPQTGLLSPNVVTWTLDPLYEPGAASLIKQQFGITPNPAWPQEEENVFNLDAVMQEAVWRRIESSVTSTQKAFFNSDEWEQMLASGVFLSIMLIGMRGPDLPPGEGALPGETPPPLVGFPSSPPKFAISNEALVTFGGAIQITNSFWFAVPWGSPIMPVLLAMPGQVIKLTAAGYRPRMQILFKRVNGGGPGHVLNLRWSGYGQVQFKVPVTAGSGMHSVQKYRFKNGEVLGVPTYTDWRIIPATHRPLFGVQ